jgi:hypothetical protein
MRNGQAILMACALAFATADALAQRLHGEEKRNPAAPETAADPRLTQEERINQARDQVAATRKVLDDYRDNPQESDFTTVANARRFDARGVPTGGGVRRIPTEEFLARVAIAEANLKAAEEALKALERSLF